MNNQDPRLERRVPENGDPSCRKPSGKLSYSAAAALMAVLGCRDPLYPGESKDNNPIIVDGLGGAGTDTQPVDTDTKPNFPSDTDYLEDSDTTPFESVPAPETGDTGRADTDTDSHTDTGAVVHTDTAQPDTDTDLPQDTTRPVDTSLTDTDTAHTGDTGLDSAQDTTHTDTVHTETDTDLPIHTDTDVRETAHTGHTGDTGVLDTAAVDTVRPDTNDTDVAPPAGVPFVNRFENEGTPLTDCWTIGLPTSSPYLELITPRDPIVIQGLTISTIVRDDFRVTTGHEPNTLYATALVYRNPEGIQKACPAKVIGVTGNPNIVVEFDPTDLACVPLTPAPMDTAVPPTDTAIPSPRYDYGVQLAVVPQGLNCTVSTPLPFIYDIDPTPDADGDGLTGPVRN